MDTSLQQRRRFFDTYCTRSHEREAELPPGSIRFSCPCCGYPTLGERGSFEICELCWWEDDGTDDEDAENILGGPNLGLSLEQARSNFAQYRLKYTPSDDPRVGAPDPPEVIESKRLLIAAFDRMQVVATSEELNALWRAVKQYERDLQRPQRRRLP
jgi:hypothetical protein